MTFSFHPYMMLTLTRVIIICTCTSLLNHQECKNTLHFHPIFVWSRCVTTHNDYADSNLPVVNLQKVGLYLVSLHCTPCRSPCCCLHHPPASTKTVQFLLPLTHIGILLFLLPCVVCSAHHLLIKTCYWVHPQLSSYVTEDQTSNMYLVESSTTTPTIEEPPFHLFHKHSTADLWSIPFHIPTWQRIAATSYCSERAT